jgi:gamma-glutamyltranspeptidase/glutathione hydrolase
MDPEFIFNSRRSPVISRGGIVAASQPLAVAAGLEMLNRGGGAADAAVAVSAALNVTEPGSTGLGGDCFALYFDASSRRISALNGSGRAPAALSIERLAKEGLVRPGPSAELPPFHPYTITVPGACAGWCDLIERFGRLSLSTVLSPAIRLAEEGYPVTPVTSYFWRQAAETRLRQAPGGLELTLDGRGPRAGEIFRNPGLARTLQKIAAGGKEAFYQGEIAAAIAGAVQAAGGSLSEADLAAHQSTWDQPIHINYRGEDIWECPPNGQGLAALLGLNILEGFDLASMPPLSTRRLHLEIEAMRLAFADARGYVSDPAFQPAPLELLLSKDYAAIRRRMINPAKASLDQVRGTPFPGSDTVYFCVVDRKGNACSFVNSNYMGFGTGIVPAGLGFSLQNRGQNFSLDPRHPNALEPGKRPYHTIIPGMATSASDGTLSAVFGVMGGFMQPQGHMQVVTALMDDGLDPQAALDRPRFCISSGNPAGGVALEQGIPGEVASKLVEMGHSVSLVSGFERSVFGRGQIIQRKADGEAYWAGSDPRADGCAMTVL